MSKSIISNERECLICNTTTDLHRHHIFYGSNRSNSETYGCWCYLCAKHHNASGAGVHFNKPFDTMLKQHCQRKFEDLHGHEKFMQVFGKNYL